LIVADENEGKPESIAAPAAALPAESLRKFLRFKLMLVFSLR
jgi:hypothetical protein